MFIRKLSLPQVLYKVMKINTATSSGKFNRNFLSTSRGIFTALRKQTRNSARQTSVLRVVGSRARPRDKWIKTELAPADFFFGVAVIAKYENICK